MVLYLPFSVNICTEQTVGLACFSWERLLIYSNNMIYVYFSLLGKSILCSKEVPAQDLRKLCEAQRCKFSPPKLTSDIEECSSHDPAFSEKTENHKLLTAYRHLKRSPQGVHHMKVAAVAVGAILRRLLPVQRLG